MSEQENVKQPDSAIEQAKAEQQAPAPEWIPSPNGVHEIYTNFLHSNWSLYDVRVRLGQLIPDPKNANASVSKWVVEERAAVTFAWAEAKVLSDLLVKLIAKYEEVNGEIKPLKLPPPP